MGNLDLGVAAIEGLDEEPWCSGPALDSTLAARGATAHVALHQLAQQFRSQCLGHAQPQTLATLLGIIIRAAARAFDAATQDTLGASRFGAETLRCLGDLVQLKDTLDAAEATLPPCLSHALDALIIQLVLIDPSRPDVKAAQPHAGAPMH